MVKLVLLMVTVSPIRKFKWRATWAGDSSGHKHTDFGATGYSDYTLHHDKERRRRYRIRHAKDRIHDPVTAGALSWHILWGPSTDMQRNITYFRTRFRV